MVDFELAAGDPKAAAMHLGGSGTAGPRASRLASSAPRREAAAREARVAQLEQDHDPQAGRAHARRSLPRSLGIFWTFIPVFIGSRPGHEHSYRSLLIGRMVMIVVTIAAAVWARDSMMKTALNRSATATVLLVFIAAALTTVCGAILGIPPLQMQVIDVILWASICAMFAATTEPRLSPSAVALALAAVGSAMRPDRWIVYTCTADFALFINMMLVWHRLGRRPTTGQQIVQ